MTKSKHTMGPWEARKLNPQDKFRQDDYRIGGPDTEHIATVWDRSFCHASLPVESNARLISAAPDLLEAAKEALRYIPERPSTAELLAKLRAAISKAKGGQP